MNRWTDIAWHPQGYVLSTHFDLKPPWFAVRLTHPDWAQRRKIDRYVWLKWHSGTRRVGPASNSPVSRQFVEDLPDIHAWAVEIMAARS
jgi:hypothetical protein